MSTSFETGHGKNVANFEDLISFCVGYGTSYNPSQLAIKVTALQTVLTSAQTSLSNVSTKNTAFKNATNARELAFEPVKKLSTRIKNAFDACGAKKQSVDDVAFYVRKLRGGKAPRHKASAELGAREAEIENPSELPVTESGNETQKHSTSQQSYDSLIEHISNLINALSAEPLYAPNETDLKVTALQTLLADLKAKNTAVINTYTAYSNARIDRNKILYTDNTGLVDLALEVKKYVKSVFGASSPQYKQVSGIKFKKESR